MVSGGLQRRKVDLDFYLRRVFQKNSFRYAVLDLSSLSLIDPLIWDEQTTATRCDHGRCGGPRCILTSQHIVWKEPVLPTPSSNQSWRLVGPSQLFLTATLLNLLP